MNRRAFLAAIPLVAVVAANQVGTREAIEVEREVGWKCSHGKSHWLVSSAEKARGQCLSCGAIYRSGRWWRVRPLTHPGMKA